MNNLSVLMKKYRTVTMGFAALWIYMFHEYIPMLVNFGRLGRVESFVKGIGCDGVEIFFFLSGLGLNYAMEHSSSLKDFYVRRFKRLVIPFLLVGILRCITNQWTLTEFIGNITTVNFFVKNIYSLLWFVPGIMALYLLFPLYYHFFRRSGNQTMFTANSILVWLIISVVFQANIRSDLFGFTNRIPVFLLGVWLGFITISKKDYVLKRADILHILLLGITGVYLQYKTNMCGVYYSYSATYGMPSTLIAVAIVMLLPLLLEGMRQVRGTNLIANGLCTVFPSLAK